MFDFLVCHGDHAADDDDADEEQDEWRQYDEFEGFGAAVVGVYSFA